jgi:ATP adenylyltransferase
MEKLWSPWRSQYIDSFKDNNCKKEGCIFCERQNQNIDDEGSLVIYKGKYTFIIMNLYPYNSGHLMVVPYRHTSNFLSFSKEENEEIMDNLQLAQLALQKTMQPHGYNIGANLGKVAGAGIDEHIHFHIVPRWNGDTNYLPVLGETRVISQDLYVTKANLQKAVNEIIAGEI